MRLVRNVLRQLMLYFKQVLYIIAITTEKADGKTVVFETFQGRSYACNPKAMYIEMLGNQDYSEYKFIWVFRDTDKYSYLKEYDRTSIVKFESFEYYKALAHAKYWIFNSNTRPFLKPHKSQVFVQTWHGTPLKKIGCDIIDKENAVTKSNDILKNYTNEAEKISYMISPSAYCTDKLISAFNLKALGKEEIVLETGYPRNVSLFTMNKADIANIKKLYSIPEDKKVILYAPTFRDNKHKQTTGFTLNQGIDFDKMRQTLSDEYVVLFRAHYFIASKMDFTKYQGFVIDVSEVDDINELYIISDMLITDYSSVFFDYANLKRPIFFYMYDYEEYKNEIRDFYIQVSELPGKIFKEEQELFEEILKLPSAFKPDDRYINFNKKYNYLDGPHCAKEAVRRIVEGER